MSRTTDDCNLSVINLLSPHQNCTKECVANQCVCSQEFSNGIQTLLEEIKDVHMMLTDLPDESLDAMEAGLKVSLAVYNMLPHTNTKITTQIPTDDAVVNLVVRF